MGVFNRGRWQWVKNELPQSHFLKMHFEMLMRRIYQRARCARGNLVRRGWPPVHSWHSVFCLWHTRQLDFGHPVIMKTLRILFDMLYTCFWIVYSKQIYKVNVNMVIRNVHLGISCCPYLLHNCFYIRRLVFLSLLLRHNLVNTWYKYTTTGQK